MANISIKLKNADKILQAFKQAPQQASKGIQKAVEQTVLLVNKTAKRTAPSNTAELRKSIRSSVNGMSGSVEVGISYAVAVHEGTRPHIIVPKNKKALANKRTGQMFGKRVNHPGTKAQPFLREAVEMSEAQINNYFLDAIKGIIKL